MLLFVYTPCGRAHRARHTAANVQSLDGYTCQGTPCLMDGPQMKPCTSLGGSSWHLSTPLDSSTARQSQQSRQSRQLSTQRSAASPSTVSTVSTVLSSCQARQSLDSCRHLLTLVDTCRQSRQSRQPGLSSKRNSWTLKSLKSREKPFQNSSISWFQSSLSKSTLESLHSETTIVRPFVSKSTKFTEAEATY